jgi:protein-arginine kinase activator protein McsA
MATAEPDYYCHKCQVHIGHVSNFECPHCRESFIEEVVPRHSPSHSRSGRSRHGGVHFHGSIPYGNTTIVINGGRNLSNPRSQYNDNADVGTFFQTILGQLVGGQQLPFVMHHGGGAGPHDAINFEAFLAQFLNQMGENSGPAPASESHINSIPTVKVTVAQAREGLQCAICMEEFKEHESVKRLPCSHHFHEGCISRWLRMHGTCPTCRVTLDGDNTSNREYYNVYPNRDQSSSSNNNNRRRRNNGGNNGSALYEFD